jgi:3'(2'), 5'-bisphosphate nucleotidase
MTEETKSYLEKFSVKALKSAGSSLKFCLLAQGEAGLYPRFGPTMEWDMAAGHAILLAAGGEVLREDGSPLDYGKIADNYKNPFFIVWAKARQKAKVNNDG